MNNNKLFYLGIGAIIAKLMIAVSIVIAVLQVSGVLGVILLSGIFIYFATGILAQYLLFKEEVKMIQEQSKTFEAILKEMSNGGTA